MRLDVNPIKVLDFRGSYKGGGGPDKTILLSAKLHNKKRCNVLVAYLRDPQDLEFQITQRAKEMGINYIEVEDKRLIDIACIKKLNNLIKEKRIQILHAHDDKTLLYGWILKLLNPNLIIVYTCHLFLNYSKKDFSNSLSYLNYYIRNVITLFLIKRYSKPIMTVSDFTKNQLLEKKFKKKDLVVVHNCIDIDVWMPGKGIPVLRDEMGLGENEFIVGTVARIAYQKDFPTFLKVIKLVKKEYQDVKFVIVGEGLNNELGELQNSVDEEGLRDFVHFTGHRNDLLNVYASFDIFLMTSILEGLPNTVLEAMAMAKPVVSTAVSGVPEIILDRQTGFLCNIGDSIALANCVTRLLKNDKLREKYGLEGRKRIDNKFAFRKRVNKLEDQYKSYYRKKSV